MQLSGGGLRARLGAAACVLLAAGAPAAARAQRAADSSGTTPGRGASRTQLDGSLLLYGERRRTSVGEPQLRITRLFPNGQSLSAQAGFDVVTGSSGTGALPTGREPLGVVTTTTPSGHTTTSAPPAANAIPVAQFRDHRGALDAEWSAPYGVLTSTLGGHFSREQDYQSVGGDAKITLDLMQRLATVTLGGGFNYDDVFPTRPTTTTRGDGGGDDDGPDRLQAAAGLVAAGVTDSGRTFVKRVSTGMVGISRVLSRRWIVGLNYSRSLERGYLDEPYKVVSVMDPDTGVTVGAFRDHRPATRDRRAVLGSTVYHFARDVLHASYRWYQDDWHVRSHTVDLAYRHDLSEGLWLEPHLRGYRQTGAWFYTPGFVSGAALPAYATADHRLGPLSSGTLGLTAGFKLASTPGEWTVRAEYVGQFGDHHPAGLTGLQRGYDLYPRLDVGTLVVGWSLEF